MMIKKLFLNLYKVYCLEWHAMGEMAVINLILAFAPRASLDASHEPINGQTPLLGACGRGTEGVGL